MGFYKDIEIVDLCLYIKKYKTLIIADVHLGYEESLNQRGVLIPKIQFKDTYERIDNILKNKETETVVVTGDLKHEFGVINNTEWNNILKIIDLFLKRSKKLIIIKGNHDVTLPFIAKKKGIELSEYYKIDDILICHGDEIIDNEDFRKSKLIIIGHEHPAIGLREKSKYEVFKCFLKGKYLDKNLIVLPSFNTLTVVEKDKVYDFGKLRNVE